MSFRNHFCAAVLAAASMLVGVQVAHATVIERVVAVVGEDAIMLSELRERARPFLLQIHERAPTGAQRAAAESEMYRQMLQRMIDDRLEHQVAEKQRISVTSAEIDSAIERLASVQGLTVEQLLAEVVRGGMRPQEYREELRRQLLEGKLLELRVKGRVRVTEEAMRTTYDQLRREERRKLPYRLQWIVLRVTDQDPENKQLELADSIVAQAAAGADFGELAKRHSDDANTRRAGGDLGRQAPGTLDEAIERRVFALEEGSIGTPFRFADAVVVLRLIERDPSKLGAYEDVRDQLGQRVYADQMEKAKRRWLDGLKRGVHIDIRL